ncbi:MAG: glycosyltransferase family 2 protein [Flavobacteriales bacterium]|nr:glycosyltransferase family 2 protein [Flavobacteriales bacterium]
MKDQEIDWTLFIFCYNEEGSVGAVIDQAVTVSSKLCHSFEVLVINDGSSDSSTEIIDAKCNEHRNVRAIHHAKNLGIGSALISGYRNAKGTHVCGIPADGQFNIEELLPFKDVVLGEVVCFVREDKRYSYYRGFLTAFNKLTNRILLGLALQDVNWAKIYHAEDLRSIDPRMKSSLIESEMCAMLKAKGVRFLEVPSIYQERSAGETKGGSFRTVGRAALEFFELVFLVNLFRIREKLKVSLGK